MMAFLDGIKLSLPAAVSHANYIVCRVDGGETPTVSFFRNRRFFLGFLFFCDATFCGSAAPPVNACF